ncbi:putative nitrilase [Neisseria gonorrhoeae]|uniref:Putative nitrilase n=1 Tax=Neisseria gonorrhoeae TaxID=485 RepID=A0A378VSX3_NEIGO|nr:putative nitrilase [Neisseria gonorrhoeae]
MDKIRVAAVQMVSGVSPETNVAANAWSHGRRSRVRIGCCCPNIGC